MEIREMADLDHRRYRVQRFQVLSRCLSSKRNTHEKSSQETMHMSCKVRSFDKNHSIEASIILLNLVSK